MKAVKRNKEYTIDEKQKKSYQEAGFDIYDNNGEKIAYGRGKTVPYADYVALAESAAAAKADNERLKARVAELEKAVSAQEKKPGKKAGE